jgi:hypothetical protein
MSDPIIIQALRDIFDSVIGEDALFARSGSAPIPVRVIVNRSVLLQPSGMDTQVYERGTTIEVILDDIDGEPVRGDVFTVAAQQYTVQSIDSNDGDSAVAVVR